MTRLTGCCCCFELRDGSRAIGITLFVLTALGLVSQIAHAIAPSDRVGSVEGRQLGGSVADIVLRIALGLLHLVFQALLVRGVDRKNRGLVKAWLIYFGITNGITSFVLAIVFVFVCTTGSWLLIMVVLAALGLVGVFWYWFVVVLHYFKEMREEDGFVYSQQHNDGEKHVL